MGFSQYGIRMVCPMKLYWRIKVDGKWTFRAATIVGWTTDLTGGLIVEPFGGIMEEEV